MITILILWAILGPIAYLVMQEVTPILKQMDGAKGKTNLQRLYIILYYFFVNMLIGPLGWIIDTFGVLLCVYWLFLWATANIINYFLYLVASIYFLDIITIWGFFPILKITYLFNSTDE